MATTMMETRLDRIDAELSKLMESMAKLQKTWEEGFQAIMGTPAASQTEGAESSGGRTVDAIGGEQTESSESEAPGEGRTSVDSLRGERLEMGELSAVKTIETASGDQIEPSLPEMLLGTILEPPREAHLSADSLRTERVTANELRTGVDGVKGERLAAEMLLEKVRRRELSIFAGVDRTEASGLETLGEPRGVADGYRSERLTSGERRSGLEGLRGDRLSMERLLGKVRRLELPVFYGVYPDSRLFRAERYSFINRFSDREKFEVITFPLKNITEDTVERIFINGLEKEIQAEMKIHNLLGLLHMIKVAERAKDKNFVLQLARDRDKPPQAIKLGAGPNSIPNAMSLGDFGHDFTDPNLTYVEDLVNLMYGQYAPDLGAARDGDGDRNMVPGWIEWDAGRFELQDAPSYSEKNWGNVFPRKWFWDQYIVFVDASGKVALTVAGDGKAGFGSIYYAELKGEKAEIKKLDMQVSREFLAEFKVLTHVHHLDLIGLIESCVEGSLFLVYEYVEKGKLSQHSRGSGKDPLPWSSGVQIALDLARGLEYIHAQTIPGHIYRDIKPAKNHGIILPDASLDATSNALVAAVFGTAGQRSMARSTVIFIGDPTSWEDKVVECANALKVNGGTVPDADLGPVISKQAKERICQLIEGGARLLLDGRYIVVPGNGNGSFIGPTLLANVTLDMECYKEGIFDLVLLCMRADSLDEVISIINKNKYGNGASLFTSSGIVARKFQTEFEDGQVGLNVTSSTASFAGDLNFYGNVGIHFFTKIKTATQQWKDSAGDTGVSTLRTRFCFGGE